MNRNMGSLDRAVRAIVGVLLLVLAFTAASFAAGALHWIAILIGIVLLGTAIMGICPAYLPFGIRTCEKK